MSHLLRQFSRLRYLGFVLATLCLIAAPATANDQQALIPKAEITALQAQLTKAQEASSPARKKLAVRRLVSASEKLLKKHATAANRFEVLGVLYTIQQEQLKVDDTAINRREFLKTCEVLAQAPDDYALLRLDADLLLTQAKLAKQGADQQARADALKPFVQRYLGTEADTQAVRIALVMAVEAGNADLITYLADVIAKEFPGDPELINFQLDKLTGNVFGAPFVGTVTDADGKLVRFPMDAMGKTTALYFWSKENGGVQQLKDLAAGWQTANAELDGAKRYQFISFNLDQLPDAGESILREIGLDWPAMHLPGSRDNPIYKTYVRNDPKFLTLTPTGYATMLLSGPMGTPRKGWDRLFQSSLSRWWSRAEYVSQVQALHSGDFLVINPTGDFNPAAPPEYQAAVAAGTHQAPQLKRTANAVPVDKLKAIQACFAKPAQRAYLSSKELLANYAKAEKLCAAAIAAHPDADDLWIVRNRRIVALLGLWKVDGKRQHFDAALQEAKTALAAGYPAGTDVVARFCIVRESLRSPDADLRGIIQAFATPDGKKPPTASSYALASLLALEVADRKLHEQYRRLSLDNFARVPALWHPTSLFLDRYHRNLLYHPPFVAGWTYGRRFGYFNTIGKPEDANRLLQLELETPAGETLRIPEDSNGKWSIIEFLPNLENTPRINGYGNFVNDRLIDNVQLIAAVLTDDVDASRQTLNKLLEVPEDKKKRHHPPFKDHFQFAFAPGGLDHPVIQQLGILFPEGRGGPNFVIVRPDGTIVAFISSLAGGKGNVLLNIVAWQDEQAVVDALAKGDLEEAKRLAFAFAPLKQEPPPGAKKNWRPATPHLRARAKYYLATGNLEAAKADAEAVYLEVNSKAGSLAMRTEELEEIERLKAEIEEKLAESTSDK